MKLMETAMEIIQRMLPLEGSKRTGLKLDGATWQAVDWLAAKRGVTWQDWCKSVVGATPAGDNITATVRAAAMNELLEATIFEGRGEWLETINFHPFMRNSAMLNDAQLEDILAGATVQGRENFGGFTVIFGHDEGGQDCVWVRNGLRDGLHFAFVIPEEAKK